MINNDAGGASASNDGLGLAPERSCTALGYATRLAISMHAKHYPEVTQWKPLPDLLGVLTQIDNMVCGLVRRA